MTPFGIRTICFPVPGPAQDPRFETLATLAAMAALTTRVRVGTLVFGALYRDPATLAKSAATVDHISGGRLEFAVGQHGANENSRRTVFTIPPCRSVMLAWMKLLRSSSHCGRIQRRVTLAIIIV